jgi:hypothetical protein
MSNRTLTISASRLPQEDSKDQSLTTSKHRRQSTLTVLNLKSCSYIVVRIWNALDELFDFRKFQKSYRPSQPPTNLSITDKSKAIGHGLQPQ